MAFFRSAIPQHSSVTAAGGVLDPRPDAPIPIARDGFDEACEQLCAQGIPLPADAGVAWRDFAGWRLGREAART